MGSLKRFIDLVNDDLAWFDEWTLPTSTAYRRAVWVDPDKFDIIPKKAFRQEVISTKEQKLKSLEEQAETIRKEIKELKQ